MEDKIFISSVVIISAFSMIYGNLALNAIGDKNVSYVNDNPIIMYLAILVYVVFVVVTMYKETFQENIFEIFIMSLLLFIAIIALVSSHPVVAISIAILTLFIYINSIQNADNKTVDYI
jgi:Na+/alanine symporter